MGLKHIPKTLNINPYNKQDHKGPDLLILLFTKQQFLEYLRQLFFNFKLTNPKNVKSVSFILTESADRKYVQQEEKQVGAGSDQQSSLWA